MESPTSALRLSTMSSLDRVTIALEKLMVQGTHGSSIAKLAEDLDRRLSLPDKTPAARLHLLFCEARHDETNGRGGTDGGQPGKEGLVSKWRQKERLKTTAVALVMCLNISVDPPDIIKVSPCARAECWIDPLSMAPQKALDAIGKQLQAQYERWQPRAKYKMHLDPTTEDVKKLALSSRRTAKNERVLFHYNGHGVPRPTPNGEIWVFNKNFTQYIPLSLYDLQMWVGTPAIYVFDCSSAGQILTSFKQFMYQRQQEAEGYAQPGRRLPDPLRESILLCACGDHEILPQNPELPADLFTACLTTPIKVALRWFCSRSRLRALQADRDLADRLPGKQTDRRTPTGELNWIFTAITDTIAWNVLPRALFQRLFRQDLLLASLFRNYLLAERVMRAHGCTPVCHPRLPPTHQHPMWQAWDLAAEMCLLQMPAVIEGGGKVEYKPSPFFSEQLTAFELWLEHGAKDKSPPEQLPIVLQVLLSQVHRLRALVLLGRFLDMGYWAVDLALSVGIFPYVLKLLQTTAPDLRQTLVFIWAKILAWDSNAQVQADLVKDGGYLYFLKHLDARDATVTNESRAHAAFVLAVIAHNHPRGQAMLANAGMLQATMQLLPGVLASLAAARERGADAAAPDATAHRSSARTLALLTKWLLLATGQLADGNPAVVDAILKDSHHSVAVGLLGADDPELRAAAIFLLCSLVRLPGAPRDEASAMPESPEDEADRVVQEREIAAALLQVVYDGSPLVRAEVAAALARVAAAHSLLFQDAVHAHQRTAFRIPARTSAAQSAASSSGSAPASGSAPVGVARSAEAAHGSLPSGADRVASSSEAPRPRSTEPGSGSGTASPPRGRRQTPGVVSPGVRPLGDAAFEPLLRVGLGDDEPASTAAGGVYASADAARVGGGLYSALVEGLCTLSTDPAPRVARTGAAALRAVGIELVPVQAPVEQPPAAGSAAPLAPPSSSSAVVPAPNGAKAVAREASAASVAGSAERQGGLLPKWQPRAWRSGLPTPAPSRQSSSNASAASPHTSPPSVALAASTRPSYVLRRFANESADGDATPGSRAGYDQGGDDAYAARAAAAAAAATRASSASDVAVAPLPQSIVYRDAAVAFTYPLLAPQSLEQPGPPHAKWLVEPDPDRVTGRAEYRKEHLRALHSLCEPGRNLQISDKVNPVNTNLERIEALCLDPIRALLLTASSDGHVLVTSCGRRASSEASAARSASADVQNHFHVVTGKPYGSGAPVPRTTVRCLHVLNELCNSMVLAGAADGAVRVWRNFTHANSQQLASAWQAVMVPPSGMLGCPTTYSLDVRRRLLHAAGGRLVGRVYSWDLEKETCFAQFRVRDGVSDPGDRLEHLAAFPSSSVLAGADSEGVVWLFDIRAGSTPVGSVSPGLGRLVGIAAEPGNCEHASVLGTPDGKLAFLDARVTSQGEGLRAEAGIWKTVEAHGKGSMTALAGHPNAPLLATATANQVVKVWNTNGDNVGVIRAHTSFLSHRPGPLTCLSWKPYDPVLAAGGADHIAPIYYLEEAAQRPLQTATGIASSVA